ncbi:MAG: metallophosphoesterase family protein [Acidimicrobiales bacterium]|jgi:3',5'-cyclic AMP phosphodiesterase CpdA
MAVIVHMSDIHFGAHVEDLAESLLTDVAAQEPDLVVVSGDLTQRARPNQFEHARAFLDRLPGPVLTVVGNHDLPLLNVPRRFLSQTRRYEHYISPDLDPVVAVPGLVAVGLDTMPVWRWKAGHVSPRQAGIVRDAFGNAPVDAWRILVTHHPVLPEELSGLVGRRLLVNTCAKTGVTVLLSGHTHVASVSTVPLGEPGRRSALAVVSGTTISRRTRGSPNTYAVLHLAGPREVGAGLTLDVRQADEMDWSVGLSARFKYTPNGVIALSAAGH